jgi:beta-galactosidase
LTFEDLNQAYGYVLYRTTLPGGQSGILQIKELRDYGLVFINGKRAGILDRRLKQDSLFIQLPEGQVTLDILVENMGRINFGPNLLKNKKGITEKVSLNGKELTGWQNFSLPFNNIQAVSFSPKSNNNDGPVLRKGVFSLQHAKDTYLDLSQWGKGCVWVNGHHLGRYWQVGPQQSIYVPAEWLQKGKNEIVVLELIKPLQQQLSSLEKPILNNIPKMNP